MCAAVVLVWWVFFRETRDEREGLWKVRDRDCDKEFEGRRWDERRERGLLGRREEYGRWGGSSEWFSGADVRGVFLW